MNNLFPLQTPDHFYADPIQMWVIIDASYKSIRSIRFLKEKLSSTRITLPVSSDLQRYFQGETIDFSSYHVDLSGLTPFRQEVLTAAKSIPWGMSITYSQLAVMMGRPGAARAVGHALGKNRVPVIIPCHRVVSKHGIGGFSGGIDLKQKLLKLESINP